MKELATTPQQNGPEAIFIPDYDDTGTIRVRSEQQQALGAQLVARGISGEHFDETDISITPDSITVIIGDNVRARDELAMVLADRTPSQTGSINRPVDSRTEYVVPSLPNAVDPTQSIRDYFFAGRGILGMEEMMQALFDRAGEDPSALDEAGRIQERFEALGGWTADSDASEVLDGLNVAANAHDTITLDTPISELSSGQISKVIIGRALFSGAGVIVMNDPSVHLDVRSRQWLETYLDKSRQAVIVTTSDMEFAESVATKVVEVLDTGAVLQTSTGLTGFLDERNRIIDFWTEEAERQREAIKSWEIHIRDLLAPAAKRSDDMAQVKRAAVTKLEKMKSELAAMPGEKILQARQQVKERQFEAGRPSGNKVLELHSFQVAYEAQDNSGTEVIDIPNLDIRKGDKVAVVGRNGSGKSTLMRSIAVPESPELIIDGEAKLGPSVTVGYYSPYTRLPETDVTLRELVTSLSARSDVSAILEYWGFGRSSSYDLRVSELQHHDEQTRAQLAAIMAMAPNFILLDEPTSYLTPAYRQRLIDSLQAYDGTLLVVSHDPKFLQSIGPNGILEMPVAKLRHL